MYVIPSSNRNSIIRQMGSNVLPKIKYFIEVSFTAHAKLVSERKDDTATVLDVDQKLDVE